MNHISLQSILLNVYINKVNIKTNHSKIEFSESSESSKSSKEYSGWKFWHDCSSFFN